MHDSSHWKNIVLEFSCSAYNKFLEKDFDSWIEYWIFWNEFEYYKILKLLF